MLNYKLVWNVAIQHVMNNFGLFKHNCLPHLHILMSSIAQAHQVNSRIKVIKPKLKQEEYAILKAINSFRV